MHFSADEKDGEEIRYFPNGKIESRSNYKNGAWHGRYERYNSAGKPEEQGSFVNGEKDGRWVLYDATGKVAMEMTFKAGKQTSSADKKPSGHGRTGDF